jgi:hypothetical protein
MRPLVADQGALDKTRLQRLIALRDHPKQLDFVFFARMWPSKLGPTCWNPSRASDAGV